MNREIILLLFPVLAGFLIPLGTIASKKFGKILAMLTFAAGAVYGIILLPRVFAGPVSVIIGNWRPPFGINMFFSPLTVGLSVVIYVLAIFVLFYDLQNTEKRKGQYYLLYSLMVFSAIGLVLTGDIFNMFVFLEIGGIASFALIGAGNDRLGSSGGLKYLIQAQIASLLMLAGIAFVYSASGVLNIAVLSQSAMLKPMFAFFTAVLILLPVFLETKLFPFNTWVPGAYNGAVSSFAGSMSSIMALAGAFVLMRLFLTMMNPWGAFGAASGKISALIIILGGITVLIGEMAALREKNLKKVLGYSSIGQMGMIAVGIGTATTGAVYGAILLVVSHSAAKLLLFLVSGFFLKQTKTAQWEKMRGIARRLPIAGGMFVVGAMTLMGIPLFSGFWGKLSVLRGALEAGGPSVFGFVAILLGTIVEGIYFMRIGHSFFEKQETEEGSGESFSAVRYNLTFLLPAILLIIAIVAVGVYPKLIEPWLRSGAKELMDPGAYASIILKAGGGM